MRLNNTPTASFSEEYTPKLGDAVLLVGSNEAGTVVGHAVYLNDAPSFRVRYVDGQGCLKVDWWPREALMPARQPADSNEMPAQEKGPTAGEPSGTKLVHVRIPFSTEVVIAYVPQSLESKDEILDWIRSNTANAISGVALSSKTA